MSSLESFWTLTTTTLALLISALIESIKGDLSLYNAILVSFLAYLHAASTSAIQFLDVVNIVDKTKLPSKRFSMEWKLMAVAAFLQNTATCIFGWYIWAKAATFGNQPMCNEETLFVIFGVTLRAPAPASRFVSIGECTTIQSSVTN